MINQEAATKFHGERVILGRRPSVRALSLPGCNGRLGTEVEAPLVSDPSIRVCVEALADRLPDDLLSKMRQRQRWFVDTDMGQVEAVGTAGGDVVPLESATFRREETARDEMVAEWRRHEMSEQEIADHLAAVDAAEPGATLVLPGFTVRPRVDLNTLEFALPLDENLVADTLPLGIAFLYLCLILGKIAYADQLEPIRAVLRANDTTPSPAWTVEHRIDRRGCAPEHRLALKETAPVVVHVQLFQEQVWVDQRAQQLHASFELAPVDQMGDQLLRLERQLPLRRRLEPLLDARDEARGLGGVDRQRGVEERFVRLWVISLEYEANIDHRRRRLGRDAGQEPPLRPAGVADRAVLVVNELRRVGEDALVAQRPEPGDTRAVVEAVKGDSRVEELLAEAADVGRTAGQLVDQRQGLSEVGFDPPHQALNDDLSLCPDFAELVVQRARRGARVAVGPLMQRLCVLAPELPERVVGADAKRVADRVDLLAIGVGSVARRPAVHGDDRSQDRAQDEVELTQ